jgi:hypothetical protein
MTHFVKEMFDQLEDLLEAYPPAQPADRQVSWEMKRHYLTMGQYAMWPRIYRIAQDTMAIVEDTVEYPLPDTLSGGRITFIEGQTGDDGALWYMYPDEGYNVVPGPSHSDVVKLATLPNDTLVGGGIRVTSTMPLIPIAAADDAAAALEEFSGPDYAVEGPALYAMNRITARGLHQRLDYGRGSVNYQNRSAVPNELMASSIFWLDEFERRVDQWQLVHPQSVR